VTSIRLAWGGPPNALELGLNPSEGEVTTVRLVTGSSGRYPEQPPELDPPSLLVSYFYLDLFKKQRPKYQFRDWVMDSGAYSAANSGKPIVFEAYIEECQRLLAEDPQLTEVFALDVIGDPVGTLRNTERMWELGIPAIPTFHVGESTRDLRRLADAFPKIALGGAVKYAQRKAWAAACFAEVWPKPIHGLGFGARDAILHLPFHSVDASNWEFLPVATGTWRSWGGQTMSVRGKDQNLRGEVAWYLELERMARQRWEREMVELDAMLVEAGWPRPDTTRRTPCEAP
jgi:hypothetical protein